MHRWHSPVGLTSASWDPACHVGRGTLVREESSASPLHLCCTGEWDRNGDQEEKWPPAVTFVLLFILVSWVISRSVQQTWACDMVPFCIGGVVNLRLHGTVSLLYFHGFPRQRKRVGCLTMELARNEINGVFYQSKSLSSSKYIWYYCWLCAFRLMKWRPSQEVDEECNCYTLLVWR